MFRRVGQVADQLKIGAAPEEIIVERVGNRWLMPAVDAGMTV
jgi:hypothetical protein